MSSPLWQTPAGNIGKYYTDKNFVNGITLLAEPVTPATGIYYTLISGELPTGLTLDISGNITGIASNIINETLYTFTVRAIDEYNNFADRTFSITVVSNNAPKFTTDSGTILQVQDSIYVDIDLQYSNKIETNTVTISLTSGSLPPGLQLTSTGKIRGYAEPPINTNNTYVTLTYTFTVQLSSQLGNDSRTYSIVVSNQQLTNPPNTRRPVILNMKPLVYPVPTNDSLYDYYLGEDAVLPDFYTGSYFSFKVIGYDFDHVPLKYKFTNLPLGLTGDENTGWITGNPVLPNEGIVTIDFFVLVEKTSNNQFTSDSTKFTITLINNIQKDIVWTTSNNLGTVDNGSISTLVVNATSVQDLSYRFISGSLPPNLTLLDTGELVGRIAIQPVTELLPVGSTITYTFTVMAYSPKYYLLTSTQTFTLTVYQRFDAPLENVYIKALPNTAGRKTLYSLLNSETIIPTSSLYRPRDPYFGKSNDVKYVHAYGMYSSDVETYTSAMNQNHYERKIILGPITYAIARDDNFNIIYEAVYSEVLDDLSTGTGLPQEITWPRDINLRQGGYTINNTKLYISSGTAHASYTPGYARNLYPASLSDMRNQIVNAIGQNKDISLLPRWMTSQQSNGNTLGYTPAWVICYALPGMGQKIVDSINNNWSHSLNEIDFTINRYVIDKSMSYNWNNNFINPFWSTLPSATPVPDPIDTYDITILFPRKTILPIDTDN